METQLGAMAHSRAHFPKLREGTRGYWILDSGIRQDGFHSLLIGKRQTSNRHSGSGSVSSCRAVIEEVCMKSPEIDELIHSRQVPED
jgi:hypothetical protein